MVFFITLGLMVVTFALLVRLFLHFTVKAIYDQIGGFEIGVCFVQRFGQNFIDLLEVMLFS